MKIKLFLFFLLALWPWFLAKAGIDEPDYEGFPTIIHNEPVYWQTNRPKFWCLHVDTEDGGFLNLDYRLAGDTLIQEKNYVRAVFGYEEKEDLYVNDLLLMPVARPYGSSYADTLYYRQEDDKVYCLQPKDNKEIMILDYGLKVGDEFTDASGEVYFVTDTTRQSNNNYFGSWYYYKPRRLNLISQRTGEEDVWIEGMGSLYWGITPSFLLSQNRVFTKLGLQPSHAKVSMGYGGNLRIWPNVNRDNYKAERIVQRLFEEKNDTRSLEYEFLGDTLYVWGTKNTDYFPGYPYAECLIDDGRIDVLIKSFGLVGIKRESEYIFWAKIPGFKPGTYQVGMPGREYVTLECKGGGTTFISEKSLTPVASREDGAIYDLSGRKIDSSLFTLHSSLKRGLYIQNGKKVAVK